MLRNLDYVYSAKEFKERKNVGAKGKGSKKKREV